MTESKLSTIEQQLLSKQATKLPPRERLELLLKAKKYPIVTKRTSAEMQLKEMLDLYNLLCIMLTQFFPNEKSESNFLLLNFAVTQNTTQTIMSAKLAKAFKLLRGYEELENKITAIQILFNEYQETFPDLYQRYNLEYVVNEHISDIIKNSRQLLSDSPLEVKELLERWEIF